MPCYDPQIDEDHKEARRKVDELTRMLCTATKLLMENHVAMTKSLYDWYYKHEALDNNRKEE